MEVNGVRGQERPFPAGLPHGSVLAPTLYKLWSADLITDLKSVPVFMYADDTATLSSGASLEQAGQGAQRAADVISSWAYRLRTRIAREMTQAIVLS